MDTQCGGCGEEFGEESALYMIDQDYRGEEITFCMHSPDCREQAERNMDEQLEREATL